MYLMSMEFPQYRKLSNNKSFYKIVSLTYFIEFQQVGSNYIVHHVEAAQYPEKLRIMDMLELRMSGIGLSTEEEFENLSKFSR